MHIGIIGFGYIGAVIGAVLSSKGNKVTAIDNNENLIRDLNKTSCSVPEPFLQEMIKTSVQKGLLLGSTSFDDLSLCDVILIT